MSPIKKELADFIAAHTREDVVMTPVSMREASLLTAWQQTLPKVPVARVLDTVLTECDGYAVPVRIYLPVSDRPLKVIIFYHGGGFAVDNVSVYDPVCRRLARATGQIVVSVEYRLAPENKYPAAYEDAFQAATHILGHLHSLQIPVIPEITLCGDSAGGCLAAVTASRLQNQAGVPIRHQVLLYPCLDFTHQFPSVQENCRPETGFTKQKLSWYFNQFFPKDADRYQASPLFGLLTEKMPETFVITVGSCPFRDEGREYVRRLRAAGVRAENYTYENMVHSYLNFEKLCFAEITDTYARIANFLRK